MKKAPRTAVRMAIRMEEYNFFITESGMTEVMPLSILPDLIQRQNYI